MQIQGEKGKSFCKPEVLKNLEINKTTISIRNIVSRGSKIVPIAKPTLDY